MLKYEIVYNNLSDEYKTKIFNIWDNVISKEEQQKRIDQTVLVFKDQSDDIVGVSTVYVDTLKYNGLKYYFFRTYVKPEARNRTFNIKGENAVTLTFNFLKSLVVVDKPKGLILVVNDDKISDNLLTSFGLTNLSDISNHRIWYKNFDESLI